jgi:anti-sigma regulatory factor (Ser/Thr protein kinase)/ribosomal protein S18 acetylase RimI-like enzyme
MASAESPPEPRGRRASTAGDEPLVDRSFSADDLYALRAEVAAHASALGADRSQLERMLIVASELATNAVRHGGGSGRLILWRDGRLLRCRVSDRGPGLADAEVGRTAPDPTASGGRGLWLCRQLADSLEIEPNPHVTVTAGIDLNGVGVGPDHSPAVTIRPATPADVADIEMIVLGAYARYVPRIGRRPAPMSADYHRLVRQGVVWVALAPHRPVGVIVLVPHPDHLLVENVAVAPGQQGLGIGTRLLRLAEEQAGHAGVAELRLYTHESMTENLALYRRRGYVETHREEQDGFRRVFLRKTLDR